MKNTYLPKTLDKKDNIKQKKELLKSIRLYKKHKYYTRKKVKSFKSKKSNHLDNVKKIYDIEPLKINRELSKKTGCSIKILKQIVKKGEGAYYSSGSRPNQTAHSWAYARLGSVLLKRNSYKIDKHVLDEYKVKKIKAPKKSRSKQGGAKKLIDCCKSNKNTSVCVRQPDKKVFTIKNRRFSKERCIGGPVRGFTMRSSCAPWKDC